MEKILKLDLPLSLENEKKRSSEIDLQLGFAIKKIENILQSKAKILAPGSSFDSWGPTLYGTAQTWIGLDFQVLQTSYFEIKRIFDQVPLYTHEKLIDLGSGYGRVGIVQMMNFPHSYFLGLELVAERVEEANRMFKKMGLNNCHSEVCHLGKLYELPKADIYFVYDFGSVKDMNSLISLFLKCEKPHRIIVKGKHFINCIHKRWDEWQCYEEKILKKCEHTYLFTKT